LLDEKGAPGIVERAYVVPPESMIGTITPEQRMKVINWSPVQGVYDTPVDRESAYEILKAKMGRIAQAEAAAAQAKTQAKANAQAAKEAAAQARALEKAQRSSAASSRRRGGNIDSPEEFVSTVLNQALNQSSRSLGNSLSRSILGTLKKAF
jgi:uncharacterized protein